MKATRKSIGSNIMCPARGETEQVFVNRPFVVVAGEQRAEATPRYYALGHTDAYRLLFVVFPSVMISSV
jgi:uncharacterized DUF497 family protein